MNGMKTLICAALILAFACVCVCEDGAPVSVYSALQIEQCANGAQGMMTLLAMCPSVADFDGAPDSQLGSEAVDAYRTLYPHSGKNASQIYDAIFTSGAYTDTGVESTYLNRAHVSIESVLAVGRGIIKVSIRADIDYGDGFEFGFYADVYLEPDDEAPFGARVTRLFFPG